MKKSLIVAGLSLMLMAPVMAHGHKGKMMENLDSNKDGKVSLQEMLAQAETHFQKMDANKDGQISQAERQAMWQQRGGKQMGERKGQHQGHRQGQGQGQGQNQGQNQGQMPKREGKHQGMQAVDSNNDGMISRAEHLAQAQKMFQRLDANKDGVLSQDELKAKRMRGPKHQAK